MPARCVPESLSGFRDSARDVGDRFMFVLLFECGFESTPYVQLITCDAADRGRLILLWLRRTP